MFDTILSEFENYQDNRDSYSLTERKELKKYFKAKLRLLSEKETTEI